jgi:hypothetical protein
MPPKRRPVLQDEDDLAWKTTDDAFDSWKATLHDRSTYLAIADFILKYRKGEAIRLHTPIKGGFNILWRLEYKDGSSAALRVPAKGMFIMWKGIMTRLVND